jgi:hypothetical protein
MQKIGGFSNKRKKTAVTEGQREGQVPTVLLFVSLNQLNFVKPWEKQGEAKKDGAWQRGSGHHFRVGAQERGWVGGVGDPW